MGKNQKDKKEEKWEDKAGSLSQERKILEKEIEEKGDIHLKNWGQMTLEGNEGKRRHSGVHRVAEPSDPGGISHQ